MAVFRQNSNYFTDFEDTGLFSGGSVVADVFADIVPELAPMTTAAVTAQQQAQATPAPTPVAAPSPTFTDLVNAYNQQGATTTTATETEAGTQYQDNQIDLGGGWNAWEKPPEIIGVEGQGENAVPIFSEPELGGFSRKEGDVVNFYDLNGKLVDSQKWDEGLLKTAWNDLGPVAMAALTLGGGAGALGSTLFGLEGAAAAAAGGAVGGGVNAAITDQNILEGALKGGLSSGLSEYLKPAVDVSQADIAGGLIPEYGTNAAYDQFISSAMTPEAVAAVAEMIPPPVAQATPVIEAPAAYYEPQPVQVPSVQAPIVTEAPTVAAAPVDNIPEMVITPEPTIAPQPVTASDLGIDYSLSNGTVMRPLTDMGGVQGIQPGTSANLDVMGGGQGLTINVGAPSTTLADALATFGGVNPAYMADMGGAQGLTYQTPTGLVTETAIIPTANILSVLGETGINTATNIGSGIGTELANLNTGVEQAITAPTTPVTPEVTPAEKNILSDLTPSQIASLLKGAMGLFGALGASKLAGGGTSAPSVGALPTQGIPLNSQDYFNAIQQNYNTLLPAMPKDVATPLAAWYNSQYTGA